MSTKTNESSRSLDRSSRSHPFLELRELDLKSKPSRIDFAQQWFMHFAAEYFENGKQFKVLGGLRKSAPSLLKRLLSTGGRVSVPNLLMYAFGTVFKECKVCRANKCAYLGGGRWAQYCSRRCGYDSPDRQKNFKRTMMREYGCEYASQSEALRQKAIDKWSATAGRPVRAPAQIPSVLASMKQTSLDRHGGMASGSPTTRKKIEDSYSEASGGYTTPFRNPAVLESIAKHWESKGVTNPFQDEGVKESIKQFYRDNYEVEHNMQVPHILEKHEKDSSRFKLKRFFFEPLQIELLCRGSEPKVLKWIQENLSVTAISTSKEDQPKVWYYKPFEEKRGRYFTDIVMVIGGKRFVIEVKSEWTLFEGSLTSKEFQRNMAKFKAANVVCQLNLVPFILALVRDDGRIDWVESPTKGNLYKLFRR